LLGGAITAASAGIFAWIGSGFAEIPGAAYRVGVKAAKVLAHGLAGGLLSAAMGGRFKDGFLGSATSSSFSVAGVTGLSGKIRPGDLGVGAIAERVAASAAIGGTASRLGGGRFANGAVSASFGTLFNDLHRRSQARDYRLALIARAAQTQSVSDPGHVSIAGFDPQGEVTEVLGFHPLERNIEAAIGWVPGVTLDNFEMYDLAISGDSRYAIQYMQVTQKQHDAAIESMRGFDQFGYNLQQRNCVHAALTALNQAGASFDVYWPRLLPEAVYHALTSGAKIPVE
jgi:hypothetical protein